MAGRRLGQHFLQRKSVLERIAAAACPEPDATVVEIGPGKGALTEHLLSRASRVIAIEVDQVLVHYLQQKFRGQEKLTIVAADVLKVDLAQWGPVTIAGNLPYYITSPIFERVLSIGPLLQNAVFLVQKEVAARVAASPGSRDYGYLTVQTRLMGEPRFLFEVPPSAFHPPPKVDSAVVQLTPRSDSPVADRQAFLEFVGICFRHKRKTLRNNLIESFDKDLIDSLPDVGKRAEQLSLEQFIELHQRILKG
ncbi:MAG: 16S rRNA (adenine(1518)-N(6)/adenine(1519)-N(6))-dimethyltransferase RsmA [Bryobacteraceae bacterium]